MVQTGVCGPARVRASAGVAALAMLTMLMASCSTSSGQARDADKSPDSQSSTAATGNPTIATTSGPPTQPSALVVGPILDPTSVAALAEAESTFQSMKSTKYAHSYIENVATGYYQFDCVGFTDWNLRQSNLPAWTAMHQQLKIKPGYVPNPDSWYGFFTGKSGPLPPSWRNLTNIGAVQPGDYWLFTSNSAIRFVGHSVVAAGPAVRLADGSYALRVFDSTGSAHGPFDTRLTDPRAINNSGLGNGTMRVFTDQAGQITSAAWSIDSRGPSMTGVQVAVGRAL